MLAANNPVSISDLKNALGVVSNNDAIAPVIEPDIDDGGRGLGVH
jgi:hypothetical protein